MKIPISIEKARLWVLSNHAVPDIAFYGSLASQLVDVMDPSIPTAATDGKRIMWNPQFVEKLADEEIRYVLLHETLHCAHHHFDRLPLSTEGNIAGDYAINLILERLPGIRAPKGALLDHKYKDMSEEEILLSLKSSPPPPKAPGSGSGQPSKADSSGAGESGQPGIDDDGGCGSFIEPDRTPNPGNRTLAEHWEAAVMQAEFVARSTGRGSAPSDMRRILDRVRASEVDWRSEMADFARTIVAHRSDWSRSSRRMATQPCIYPRRKRDDFGTLVVVRDTSGSIDRPLCSEFSAQITHLCGDLNCRAIVIDCDTRIHAEYRLEPGDTCPLDARGGGGTAFEPAFARVRQLIDEGETIAGLIYLTDLDGSFPSDAPDYPVLWAAYSSGDQAPFGRVIHVK